MTPAEELRAAAAKLREMAKATAGGTWTAEYLDNHDAWWVTHESTDDDGSTTWGTVADLDSIDMAGNAAWIALMGPDKAETLAVWLEAEATCQEAIVDDVESQILSRVLDAIAGRETGTELTTSFNVGPQALAFARAILGEKR